MKTATDAALLAELTTDPEKLGYQNADRSWKTAAQIGHLLCSVRIVRVGPQFTELLCRATELWDGGAIDLKRIARVLYGDTHLDVMLSHGDLHPHEHAVEVGKAAAEAKFLAGELTEQQLLAEVERLNVEMSQRMHARVIGMLKPADRSYIETLRQKAREKAEGE